jgi:histidinol-phosphate aminotransferase
MLANPNNPTGSFLPASEVARLHAGLPPDALFVLDQAYAEYLEPGDDDQGLALAERHANVLVTRTFSKIYGLAGERIGWATGTPELIGELNRTRGPFNVTNHGQAAALAAVGDDGWVERSRTENAAERARFVTSLEALGNHGIRPEPSEGNFVRVLFEGTLTAEAAIDAIGEAGYAVRHLPGQGLPHALRITIGTRADMDRVTEAISLAARGVA